MKHIVFTSDREKLNKLHYIATESLSQVYNAVMKSYNRRLTKPAEITEGISFYVAKDEREANVIVRASWKTKPLDVELVLLDIVRHNFISNAKLRNRAFKL